MELNMNMNCMKDHGLDDDDNFSNISRISCGLQNSMNSACNSDSECSGPVSVRDMIQHYNNQLKKSEAHQTGHKGTYKVNTTKKYHHSSQHLLASTKSSYCGLNNYGSYSNFKQFIEPTDNQNHNTCCKSCTACACCQNRSRKTSTTKMLSSTSPSFLLAQSNENNKQRNSNFSINNSMSGSCIRSCNTNCNKINAKDTRIFAVANCDNINNDARASAGADINIDSTTATPIKSTILNDFSAELNKDSSNGLLKNHSSQVVVEKQKNHLLSTDSVEEANICQQPPIETSYQSKTTIAKTSSGVRIIIDIFFDQERYANAADIVGSRVETDIPQSHILAEFQQQTMTSNGDAAPSS